MVTDSPMHGDVSAVPCTWSTRLINGTFGQLSVDRGTGGVIVGPNVDAAAACQVRLP